MSGSNAISQVSLALQKLLISEIKKSQTSGSNVSIPVTLLNLNDGDDSPHLNLFLYKIVENATLKNFDWQADNYDPTRMVPPPLSLNLFYMLTAYGPNDPVDGNIVSQELLGIAMQILFENTIIPDMYLGELANAREKIKIMLCPFDIEECSKLWSMSTKPYRLSVFYEISTVQLESSYSKTIAKRVRFVGAPFVEAPFTPPTITHLKPSMGRPGSTVTVYGKYFTGWSKAVVISGLENLETNDIDDVSFSFSFPEHYTAGLYQIQILIDSLTVQTFFFEITE